MKTFLCVAEKPSVAKTATNILSKGNFQVELTEDKYTKNNYFQYTYQNEEVKVIFTSVKGHLFTLDFENDTKDWSKADPYILFTSEITSKPQSFFIINNLRKLSKVSDYLLLWLDNDLEGEKISEEVEEVCLESNPKLIVKRCRFSALSEYDLYHAFNNPCEINRADSLAVKLRMETDLRAGSVFTRFQTVQLKQVFGRNKIISYGTCQFPTLGFIVEAYNESKNYVPEKYWYISTVIIKNGFLSELKWLRKRLFCKLSCFAIYSSILSNPICKVIDIEITTKKKTKPYPLTTVVLQKKASKYFKINPTETMRITEKLYSKGYISYTRTGTDSYPNTFNYHEIVQVLKGSYNNDVKNYASNLVIQKPNQGKHYDNAHPPIYPIKIPVNVEEKEMKMFDFISRYYLATISKDAIGENIKVYFNIGDEIFSLKGFRVIEKNFLNIYPYPKWNSHTIPSFTKGETISIKSIKMIDGHTFAPSLISEHRLIKRMNDEGIGTDATIADIIRKITNRKYTYKKGDFYYPSHVGLALINGYKKMGFDFDKPTIRADLEKTMKKVSVNPEVFNEEKRRIISEYQNAYQKVKDNVSIFQESFAEQMQILNDKRLSKYKHRSLNQKPRQYQRRIWRERRQKTKKFTKQQYRILHQRYKRYKNRYIKT